MYYHKKFSYSYFFIGLNYLFRTMAYVEVWSMEKSQQKRIEDLPLSENEEFKRKYKPIPVH